MPFSTSFTSLLANSSSCGTTPRAPPRLQLMPITRIARFARVVTHSALFSLDVVDGDLSCVLGGIQRNRTKQFAWINCSRFVIRWGGWAASGSAVGRWAGGTCRVPHCCTLAPPSDINLYLQKCKQKLLIHAHLKERRQAKAEEKAGRQGAGRGRSVKKAEMRKINDFGRGTMGMAVRMGDWGCWAPNVCISMCVRAGGWWEEEALKTP